MISIINIRYISVHKYDSRSFENEPLNKMGRICEKCDKVYSSRQSLYNHRKYCKGGNVNMTLHSIPSQDMSRAEETNLTSKILEKAKVRRKLFISSLVYGKDRSDIPTFDGAEFSGEKLKSDGTLLNLMKVLRIPHEYQARFLKEEKEYDGERFKNSRTVESEQKGMKLSPLIGCCK